MRHVSRTQYGLLKPTTKSQTFSPKEHFKRDDGMIFFVCSTSAISAHFAVPGTSAWFAATPKGWLKGCKNNQRKTGLWRNPGQRQWIWPVLLLQVLQLWTVRLRREAQGYSNDRLDYHGKLVAANANQNSNSDAASSSQGWQRDAQLFLSTDKLVAMMMIEHQGCSGKFKVPEDSGDSEPKSRIWPHHFQKSPEYVPHMEKVFLFARKRYDRKPTEKLKDFDVNPAIWGVFMFILDEIDRLICDPSIINLRSPWCNYSGQLRGWSKSRRKRQECLRSTGTSARGENRLCCVIELFELWNPKPTSFPTRCFAWEASVQNQFKLGKTKLYGIWKFAGPNCRRADGIRVEKIPRIHYIGNSQWDWEYNGRNKVCTWAISRKDHLHAQWNCIRNSRKWTQIVWRILWMLQHVPQGFH